MIEVMLWSAGLTRCGSSAVMTRSLFYPAEAGNRVQPGTSWQ